MNAISIPGFHVISENGKDYTVYDISVTVQGRTHDVQRRYSELFHLHKILKKQVVVPQFPPKQMRNLNTKVIENRRNGLQQYLQWVLSHEPHSNILLDLLNVPHLHNGIHCQSTDSLDGEPPGITHCSVIHYKSDFASACQSNGRIKNSIITGVMAALYNN